MAILSLSLSQITDELITEEQRTKPRSLRSWLTTLVLTILPIAKFLMGDSGIWFKELAHYFLILQAEVSHN